MRDLLPRRTRAAVKSSLVVLAVLLVLQATLPVTWSGDGSRHNAGSAATAGNVAAAAGEAAPAPAPGESERGRLQGGGGGGGDGSSKGGVSVSTLRPMLAESKERKGLKYARTAPAPEIVLDTVDLYAEQGYLWQPISMRPPECKEGELDCDTVVRFCLMSIREYQENPWKFPMATMLQKRSNCGKAEHARSYRLSSLRAYMRKHPDEFLQPTGFVYHETRTGSTLVANMLAHVPSNLVLSENSLAEDPFRRCLECTPEQRRRLAKDILPMLGSARAGHTHVFFKFQDSTTVGEMTKVFPEVPWVFLFRDPVEVMVSNLKGAYGKRNKFYEPGFDFDAADNSTENHKVSRPASKASKPFMSPCLISRGSMRKGPSKEVICATRLKELCQSPLDKLTGSLQQLQQEEQQQDRAAGGGDGNGGGGRKSGRGAVVEYTNLPDVMTEFIYPELFGMGSDLLERHLTYLSAAARMYSKSMTNAESEFAMGTDLTYKHVMAEKAYQEAAESTGLTGVYKELQALQTWRKEK